MKILKKIIGVLLLLLGLILSIGTLFTTIKLVINKATLDISSTYDVAHFVGNFIGLGTFIVIIYFLFKFGLKLTRTKNKPSLIDIIDDNHD
jgi:hypothetical protein